MICALQLSHPWGNRTSSQLKIVDVCTEEGPVVGPYTGRSWEGLGGAPKKGNAEEEAGTRQGSEMSRLPCFAQRIKKKDT